MDVSRLGPVLAIQHLGMIWCVGICRFATVRRLRNATLRALAVEVIGSTPEAFATQLGQK